MVNYKLKTKFEGAKRTSIYEKSAVTEEVSLSTGDKEMALASAIVTISTGKKFYVDAESKTDIIGALAEGILIGAPLETEVDWKLAEAIDGSQWAKVTMFELQEASKLGLQFKGGVINA